MRPALTRAQLERLNGAALPLLTTRPRNIVYKTRSLGWADSTFYVVGSAALAVELLGGSLAGWERVFSDCSAPTVFMGTETQMAHLHAEGIRRQRARDVVGQRHEEMLQRLRAEALRGFELWLGAS